MEAKCPRVEIQNIDKLGLSIKKGSMKVSFEVTSLSQDILRLIYLQASARPLNIIIESPQTELDLRITQVNILTGEVVKDEQN